MVSVAQIAALATGPGQLMTLSSLARLKPIADVKAATLMIKMMVDLIT